MSDVGELVENRWSRYGHDRVYLEAKDGTKVGHIDLKTNSLELLDCRFEQAAQAALARWCEIPIDPVIPATASKPTPTAKATPADTLPKLIKADRDSECTGCGTTVADGADLFLIPGTRVAVCPQCTAGEVAAGLDTGIAGGAASRIADGAARKHAERLLAAYPMLGSHLVANARPTANMHAWMRGADGERIVGRKLDIAAEGGRITVLHDRRMPNGGNIDHLVIGPRRISVIDAKHYRQAKVTKRNGRLMINGKSAEHLIDGVRHQQAAVAHALSDHPRVADNVAPVLAFVGAKLGFADSIAHRGVWCSTVKEAVTYASWRLPVIGSAKIKLDKNDRRQIAELLAAAFPAC